MTKFIKFAFLLIPVLFLNSCASIYKKDAYYDPTKPIKNNYGLIFASTTADKAYGNALITYIKLMNIETKKVTQLESRTCMITKNSLGMGPLARFIIKLKTDGKPIKDQIDSDGKCGSLLVGEIPPGQYQLKHIRVESYNNGQAYVADWVDYIPNTKQIIKIDDQQIVYFGNLYTKILKMDLAYNIHGVSLYMSDNYKYDSKIFKQTYKLYQDATIKNNTIKLEQEYTR